MALEATIEAGEAVAPHALRIVVVDDHIFMRELITTTLNRQESRYTVVASVGNATAAIEACRVYTPDLLILDINLPDQSGIDVVPAIRTASPGTHVLLCTAFPTADRLADALRAGAKGFVEKTNTWDDFLSAVDRVGRGEQYFSSKTSGVTPLPRETLLQKRRPQLGCAISPREIEVLRLIALGNTSKEVATQLFISVGTVETHRAKVMEKLGLRNVAGLVLYAFQHGLVEAPVQSSAQ